MQKSPLWLVSCITVGTLILSLTISCKPRLNRNQTQSAGEMSGPVDEDRLEQLKMKRSALINDAESRDLYESNQWYQPHMYAQLDPREKQILGEPTAAQQSVLALADDPRTNTAADAELRALNEEIRILEANLAKERSRVGKNELSMRSSMCKVLGDGDSTGCFCFQRWKFNDTYPRPNPGENPCKGTFGDFCGTGLAFQVPSFRLHEVLMNFPAFPGLTPKRRDDLAYFLERDFTYRGCRQLAAYPISGHANLIKDQLRNYMETWVNSPNSAPDQVKTRTETNLSCFDFRRRANEIPIQAGQEQWGTGQCIPIYGYNQQGSVATGTASTNILRDDPKEFIPQTDLKRFQWSNKKEPFARVYCAKDWVVSSHSLDPDINYGSLLEVGASYALADVSLSSPEGTYQNIDAAISTAKASVEKRWEQDCRGMATYNQAHPLAAVRETIYNWKCDGEAHWKGSHIVAEESEAPPAAQVSRPRETYCSFYDGAFETVRQCEIDKGRNGGDSCCVDALMRDRRFDETVAKQFCKNYKRDFKTRGLSEIDENLQCAKVEQDFLQNPGNPAFKDLLSKCRQKFKDFGTGIQEPDKIPVDQLVLAKRKAILSIVDLEKERAYLSKDWFRGIALRPQRDCDRVDRIAGVNRFIPCHELFPKIQKQKDPVGCYTDGSVPDLCNGDPSAECAARPAPPAAPPLATSPAATPAAVTPAANPQAQAVADQLTWQCTDMRTRSKIVTPCTCESANTIRFFR